MQEASFSSKELFAFDDNGVPPFIRDCFVALISPFEELFDNGRVPSRASSNSSGLPSSIRDPTYPLSYEFKKDWLEWIYLELKVRLESGVRYYNFRGERLAPDAKPMPLILFLRKFRRVETGRELFPDQEMNASLREMGVLQVIADDGHDAELRGQIERKFASYPVLWIANPRDPLSLSGYLTREDAEGGYRLNSNSLPYVLPPMWGMIQRWQETVGHLIRACDAIVISNKSSEGGIRGELELVHSANGMDRTFVTNPESLDARFSGVRRVDDLTEETLRHLKGAELSELENVAGWGHWAGFESLEYARQYIAAIDELWGSNLDSGRDVSPGYFASLFTAMMALLLFRGEWKGAAGIAQGLAGAIVARHRGQSVEFLRGPGEFHTQDLFALQVLMDTSKWYAEHEELYHTVVGFNALYGDMQRSVE